MDTLSARVGSPVSVRAVEHKNRASTCLQNCSFLCLEMFCFLQKTNLDKYGQASAKRSSGKTLLRHTWFMLSGSNFSTSNTTKKWSFLTQLQQFIQQLHFQQADWLIQSLGSQTIDSKVDMKLGAKWQFCSKTCHCSLPESVDQLPVCLPKSHI